MKPAKYPSVFKSAESSLINQFIRTTALVHKKEDYVVWKKMVKNVVESFNKMCQIL